MLVTTAMDSARSAETLKSAAGWRVANYRNPDGSLIQQNTDTYGFRALPTGDRYHSLATNFATFWSVGGPQNGSPWQRYFADYSFVQRWEFPMYEFLPVDDARNGIALRCVKD